MPQLIILTGGNGAGKSTYFELFLKEQGWIFVNADLIAKDHFADSAEENSLRAARIAEDTRARLVDARQSFCFETVFSHPSKIDFLAQAKARGYQVKMIAIYTCDKQLNCARVHQRVLSGGHTVPEAKIIERIPRTHDNIGKAIPLCDQFVLLDNSDFARPYQLRLAIAEGRTLMQSAELPDFAANWSLS